MTGPAPHRCVVLGLGLRAQAQAADLQALWLQARQQQPALENFCAVAVLQGKEQRPALQQWAAQLPFAVAMLAVAEEALPAQPVVTQSPRLLARYGTGSVAEAVALSAAAPTPRLLLARLVAGDGSATLAAALRERSTTPYCCLAAGLRPADPQTQGVTA